ncbi:hypothetical protein [Micromonospora echinofusca]|uniref:Uncharacterized protein n=1 Tax=Micromonospora echinofusca TaxID=47858 RepID=A0ABS3VIY0_MICEH|nr:hypothetical protein [Micromonospora echinofusca]MBO4204426.1 hypothetical protein [Micromonospora echinofusca]
MRYLSLPQVELLLHDLRDGPSSEFSRMVTWRLPVDVCVEPLQRRFADLIGELRLARRVRRDDHGWYLEPTPYPPEVYVERHLADGDGEAAQQRLVVERQRSLDPVSGPLARGTLLLCQSSCAYLVVAVHNLSLEWCSPLRLARELTEAALPEQPLAGRHPRH